ncbi:ROK family protein [Streptococcus iniae]
MIRYLAIGMMNLYYCCDPEMIFIGGGISQNPDFINQLKEEPQQLTANYEGFPVAPEIADLSLSSGCQFNWSLYEHIPVGGFYDT